MNQIEKLCQNCGDKMVVVKREINFEDINAESTIYHFLECIKCGLKYKAKNLNKISKDIYKKNDMCLQCGNTTIIGKSFCSLSCQKKYNIEKEEEDEHFQNLLRQFNENRKNNKK